MKRNSPHVPELSEVKAGARNSRDTAAVQRQAREDLEAFGVPTQEVPDPRPGPFGWNPRPQ